ncbi:DNA-directed RNA polymerase I subunit rpa49 [Bienertia sinuspersici]
MEAVTNPKLHKSKKKKRKSFKLDASVDMYREQPDKNGPTLGYYTSGFDPLSRKSSESNALKLYRNQKKVRRVEFVVKPNECEVDFVGTNYSGEAAAGRMNSFAIAVVDKAAQKFTIAPINTNRVMRLQPLARASHTSDKEPDTPAKIASAEDIREQRGSLLNRYGTKGAINKAKKAMQLRQQEDPDAQQEVNQALEDNPIDKSAIASSNSDTSRDIPPYDLSATTPEKAYLLDKIIPKGHWSYLDSILKLLQAGKEIKANAFPSFVCNRCYKVELTKDEAEKGRLAGIMSYISHLITFKNRYSLDGFSSSQHQNIPSILFNEFTSRFLDVEKNRLSNEKIGSLISYVLVLTLFIDEFQTDFTDIAKDLKMSAFSLRPYFENLGCQFKRRNNAYLAHLPVPLKFPTIRRKRRRG